MAEHRELDGFITDPCAGRHILEYDFPLNCHSWCFSPQWLDIRSNIRSVSNSGETVRPIRLTRKGATFFTGTAYIGHKREVMPLAAGGQRLSEDLLSKSPPALASLRCGL